MSTKPTRREFLGTTTAAAVATTGWAGAQLYADSASHKMGPHATVNMGLIGCGGRGRAVMNRFAALPGCRVVAVCDLHETRLAEARKQFGGEKVRAYGDYRKLLDDKDVDTVLVATNGHWHVLTTVNACQAGKDVYVEKPLGTSIGEGRAAANAAKKYKRIVQIGTQQHSWEHYAKAVEIIQSGQLGEISEVKTWDMDYFYPGFGSPPDSEPPKELNWKMFCGPSGYKPYNINRFLKHYWFFDYGGAWQLDWAVHHYDIIHWAMGTKWPISATALGGPLCFDKCNIEWPDTFSGILEYGPCAQAKKGFLLQYTFRAGCRREQRSHGKIFYGSEASMILDRSGYTIQAEARGKRKLGEVIETFRGKGDNHQEVFLGHVRNRTQPTADVETGHYASNPGHLMNIAWKVGRKIRWDGQKEQVLDDEEAQALVTKKYAAPWKLEV